MCYNKLVCYTRAEFARMARRFDIKAEHFAERGNTNCLKSTRNPSPLREALSGRNEEENPHFRNIRPQKYKSEEEFYVYGCNL